MIVHFTVLAIVWHQNNHYQTPFLTPLMGQLEFQPLTS